MTKNTSIEFSKRYHAALRLHLRGRPRERLSSRLAGSLGRAAVALGLDTMDLARVHDRAVAALAVSPSPTNGRDGNGPLTPAGVFLLEALVPVEQKHQAANTAARLQVQHEMSRRKAVEKQLAQASRHYDQLLSQSQRMQDQSRHLAHQILSAQEEERKAISRELHDDVAQILAGINVQLAALTEVAETNSRSLQKRIAQTQRLVEQSVEAVHRYARELRPALLDDLGLIPALRSYIRDLPGRKGLRVRFTAFAGVENLDNTRRTVLYRVVQEALTNVARHAHARLVKVRIHKASQAVRLEVYDDGKSFRVERILSSNTHKRLGLLGMRERVEMVGGTFSIESTPGKGTTVRAEIPFRGSHR
ncbi:MAG TPA: sensor histidine kinase [Opitutaceae bacterium]